MKVKSPKYFDQGLSDQKDAIIAQLRAENLELKTLAKTRDLKLIHSHIIDLENQLAQIQEDRIKLDTNGKYKEEMYIKDSNALKRDLELLKLSNDENAARNLELTREIGATKSLIDAKNLEIENKKMEIGFHLKENQKIEDDKKLIASQIFLTKDSKNNTLMEVEKGKLSFELLAKSKKLDEQKIISLEYDALQKAKQFEIANNEAKLLEYRKKQLEAELGMHKEANYKEKVENERLQLSNIKLQEEKSTIGQRAKTLENQILLLEYKIAEIVKQITRKEDEIKNAKLSINYSEGKNFEANNQLLALKREKDSMELLMQQYRKESELNKLIKDDEISKTTMLESKKKELENIVLSKEFETLAAKKELEKAELMKRELQEDHYYINNELIALQDHAKVLEKQNLNLHKEVETIVNTDEKIRSDLDRKLKFDYLKSKNLEELQRSAEKVRLSSSPKRK